MIGKPDKKSIQKISEKYDDEDDFAVTSKTQQAIHDSLETDGVIDNDYIANMVFDKKEEAKADMEKMLDYIDVLNELDTDGIEPMSHVFPVQNVFREDVVTNGDNKEATLANAPLRKEDSFEVPKTIG